MAKTKAKTPAKTPALPTVPQAHGGALVVGGHGQGGRPVERWRRACREALERSKGLLFVADVIEGKVGDEAVVNDVGVVNKPTVRDRLYAVQLLAEHGHGKPPQELQIDDARARPTGEALVARVLELLPRVVALLPVDKQEIARLFKQRQEIEVLVKGRVVK